MYRFFNIGLINKTNKKNKADLISSLARKQANRKKKHPQH